TVRTDEDQKQADSGRGHCVPIDMDLRPNATHEIHPADDQPARCVARDFAPEPDEHPDACQRADERRKCTEMPAHHFASEFAGVVGVAEGWAGASRTSWYVKPFFS